MLLKCQHQALDRTIAQPLGRSIARAFDRSTARSDAGSFQSSLDCSVARALDRLLGVVAGTDILDSDVVPSNLNLEHYASACPIDKFQAPSGFYDVLGNVWHHSATMLDVLEGFSSHPLYEDFSTPTVDSYHSRIMGGSFMSTGANGGTRDSRYGFRRHFYQHAGFRYVDCTTVHGFSVWLPTTRFNAPD